MHEKDYPFMMGVTASIPGRSISHQIVNAAEPPKGPEIALFRTRTMQTCLAVPTTPVHFVPEGIRTLIS